jgi:apolipoprotein N-acyltransferase
MTTATQERTSPLSVVLAGAATAALLTSAFPPWNVPIVAWFALAPLFYVIPRLSWRGVEWLGFLTGLAFYAFNFRWFYDIFGFPAIGLWGILALFFAAFCVLVRSLPPDVPTWQRVLLTGCFWVAVEFVRCEQWPLKFSWLALGYSQHDAPFRAIYSWGGVYWMSFLIAGFAAWLASARRFQRLAPVTLLAGAFVVMLPSRFIDPDVTGIGSVVAVQTPAPSVADQMRLSDAEFARGGAPALMAWPEYTVQQTPDEAPEVYADLGRWAKAHHTTLVFGGVAPRGDEKFSSAAYVIGPDGRRLGVYEKHDPLPFFQDGEPGSGYPVFPLEVDGRSLPFGVTICFDLCFERSARRLVTNGARLLVVPSEEPPDWPRLEQEQHAIIAPVRAAENGVGILRASAPGPSQSVVSDGNVLQSLPSGSSGVMPGASYDPPPYRTFYNRIGWLFPWLCQATTALWIIRFIRMRRRGGQADPALEYDA